jgi:hypothetical protein
MNKNDKIAMPRKIQVTLPDRVGDDLERWAEYEGRPLANLCNYLLEAAVKAEKEKGAEWAKQATKETPNKGN